MNHLTDREIRCVRFLAERYKTTDRLPNYVSSSEIPTEDGESHDDIKNLVQRMTISGLVEWRTNESFIIKPKLLDIASELDNPPRQNHLEEWKAWCLSKPALAAVAAVIVICTTIAALFDWIVALLSAVNP